MTAAAVCYAGCLSSAGPYTAPVAYICNADYNSVSVVNVHTGQVGTTIELPAHADGVAVSSDGNRVYVTNGHNLSIIDAWSDNIIKNITFAHKLWGTLMIDAAGERLYQVDDQRDIYIVDLINDSVAGMLNNEYKPRVYELQISPDGKKLYQGDFDSSAFVVTDIQNNSSEKTNLGAGGSTCIAISPDGRYAYLSTWSNARLFVVNLTTLVPDAYSVPYQSSQGIVASGDGRYLYATGYDSDRVFKISAADGAVLSTYKTSPYPKFIAISPSGRYMYVNHVSPGHEVFQVSSIDLKDGSSRELDVKANEYGLSIAFNPASSV